MRINIPKFADIDILLKENDFDLFDEILLEKK